MRALILSSTFLSAFSQSDFFGKLIFLGLFALSISSWVVIIYKISITRKTKFNSFKFENIFSKRKENILNFHLDSFNSYLNPYYVIYSSVKTKTLEILKKNSFFSNCDLAEVYLSDSDVELIESEVDATISHQIKFLEKNLFVLSTVITLAPFLGLLGTVWGILLTFSNLQASGIASANSSVLSGLSLALATTVIGLVVAIPALIGYNYLKSYISDYTKEMEHFSHNLMTTLELQYKKVEKK